MLYKIMNNLKTSHQNNLSLLVQLEPNQTTVLNSNRFLEDQTALDTVFSHEQFQFGIPYLDLWLKFPPWHPLSRS